MWGMLEVDVWRKCHTGDGSAGAHWLSRSPCQSWGRWCTQESEGKQSRAEIRAACVEFINSIPHLEAVDGAVLQYRCNICQSKRMRDGKLNRLGDKPTLHGVKSFMTEHLNSQGHVRALARLTNVPLPEVATEPAADLPEVAAPGFAELACDGYSVSNPASSGTLHWYSHEFGLWATHTKLDAKASHTYHQHPNHGGWVVKHKDWRAWVSREEVCCFVFDCDFLEYQNQYTKTIHDLFFWRLVKVWAKRQGGVSL